METKQVTSLGILRYADTSYKVLAVHKTDNIFGGKPSDGFITLTVTYTGTDPKRPFFLTIPTQAFNLLQDKMWSTVTLVVPEKGEEEDEN